MINRAEVAKQAEQRLSGENNSLRHPQKEEDVSKKLAQIRAPFDRAVKELPQFELSIHESPQAILLTNYPDASAKQLLKLIEDMCQIMNGLFGLPETANIWNGKVMVAAFSTRESLVAFEKEIMGNKNIGSTTMLYHADSSRFMAVCHRKAFGEDLLQSLCWSISGGYLKHYRSDVPECVNDIETTFSTDQ